MRRFFGGSSGSADSNEGTVVPSRPRSVADLARTGRYVRFEKPEGGMVHMVGIVPCSSTSEEEVRMLVNKVNPDAIYIDLPEEDIEQLDEQLRVGLNCKPPLPGPDFPRFRWDPQRGFLHSLTKRSKDSEKDIALLAGGDFDRSYRAALQLAKQRKSDVVAYPYPLKKRYIDGTSTVRVIGSNLRIEGDNSVGSMTNYIILTTTPEMNEPLFKIAVSLSPERPFLTTTEVEDIRKRFVNGVDNAALRQSADTFDAEKPLNKAIQDIKSSSEGVSADQLEQIYDHAQKQAKAVAFTIQKQPKNNVVAVVDLARMQGYQRNWNEAVHPEELYPERTFQVHFVRVSLVALPGLAVGYGLYRSFRRFPKTTAGAGILAGLLAWSKWWEVTNAEFITCGGNVRAALARPVPPIGANLSGQSNPPPLSDGVPTDSTNSRN
eukprot:gb/GECG01003990.1/.p1 GENE.gb/GECG01003990.1/~~gb/GECG01003990.1/.p1  ORF type:complete len:434 (+),score=56.26 gb/GECG01003990.1/:1-1302(+)